MAKAPDCEPPEEKFDLSKFNVTNMVDEMKKQMRDDVFVLDGVALQGQATALYAKPNTGKTLLTIKMLTDSVEAGRIDGQNVYYVNADDSFKGAVTKGEIFKNHNINMLVPGFNDFDPKNFTRHMDQMVIDNTANGTIIVLDTLKKFTNLMNKDGCSNFMAVARRFVTGGGTLILLAHTNKRRDDDKRLVAGGTSDVIDDADCAYLIDSNTPKQDDTEKVVVFENIKNRGNVERELCFTYSIEQRPYGYLLDSVSRRSGADMSNAKAEAEAAKQFEKDEAAIDAIAEVLSNGAKPKTELIRDANQSSGISQAVLRKVLERYTGTAKKKRSVWGVTISEHNTKTYYLLSNAATAEDYVNAKEGY
ncbi:AAA domain-containing protein [Nitrosomonas marina]|uniref:AAA domain-containing protein n=2 Tax=Nitrosomonas marina TaxID=917 RepID=A0A1H8I5W3_9PROT|nr:AAA domain-containing protein [Nitrosomonas marina]